VHLTQSPTAPSQVPRATQTSQDPARQQARGSVRQPAGHRRPGGRRASEAARAWLLQTAPPDPSRFRGRRART